MKKAALVLFLAIILFIPQNVSAYTYCDFQYRVLAGEYHSIELNLLNGDFITILLVRDLGSSSIVFYIFDEDGFNNFENYGNASGAIREHPVIDSWLTTWTPEEGQYYFVI